MVYGSFLTGKRAELRAGKGIFADGKRIAFVDFSGIRRLKIDQPRAITYCSK